MKSICFVAPKAPPIGGIATWYETLSNNLMDNGYQVLLVNTSVSQERMNATSYKKSFYKFRDFVKQNKDFKKTLKESKIDILHIATSGKQGFIRDYKFMKRAKKHNVKCILHFHFGRAPELVNNRKLKESKNMLKACDLADEIITIDKNSYDSLSKIYSKICYINNPVKIEYATYKSDSKEICYVGTLNKNKGITDLVNAFNQIAMNNTDWTLNLIGPIDDDYVAEFNSLTKSKNIIVRGKLDRNEVLEEIRKSAFTILPSYTEGMPYSILESMANRVPAIATNVGSIPELIEQDLLFEPGDQKSLMKLIQYFIDNPTIREKYADKSLKKIKDSFNVDIIRNKLEEIWNKL